MMFFANAMNLVGERHGAASRQSSRSLANRPPKCMKWLPHLRKGERLSERQVPLVYLQPTRDRLAKTSLGRESESQ